LPTLEPILLTAAQVCTFQGFQQLTNASGFFFERDDRLFIVTSRHVLFDEPSKHYPDRIEIELHTDEDNLARSTGFSIPLYRNGKSIWLQRLDTSGQIDVSMIEIERSALPARALYRAFTPAHLQSNPSVVEVGTALLVVGFPLGFHDTLHHMPVVRHAIVASSFGLRFEGKGYFLTDARTHRGTSGAPVVTRVRDGCTNRGDLPWLLLGIHSAQLDVGARDLVQDEGLGLNCAWYSDVLMKLSDS